MDKKENLDKAIELHGQKYTEDDMRKCFEAARENNDTYEHLYLAHQQPRKMYKSFDDYIKTIQK